MLLRGDMVMALYYSALFYMFLRMWLVFFEHQYPAGSLQE
jgi:hypothetical protein